MDKIIFPDAWMPRPTEFLLKTSAANLNQSGWRFEVPDPKKSYIVEIFPDENLEEDNRHLRGGSISEFGDAYILCEIDIAEPQG